MKSTLSVLNELESAGLYERYAIGGAIAALFYLEPFQTEDLDIMILLNPGDSASLAPLSRIYQYLREREYSESDVFVIIEGVQVQFLVAYSPLVVRAVHDACEVMYEGIPTRVVSPEFLTAIMIQTGREKDRARFDMMLVQGAFDDAKLREIVTEFGLLERMERWMKN